MVKPTRFTRLVPTLINPNRHRIGILSTGNNNSFLSSPPFSSTLLPWTHRSFTMSPSEQAPSRSVQKQNKLVVQPPSTIPRITADHPLLAKDKLSQLLDDYRPQFTTTLHLQAIGLEGRQLVNVLNNKNIVPHFFNAVGYRHVQQHPGGDPQRRIVILNVPQGQSLPASVAEKIETRGFETLPFTVRLGWEHINSDQILETILPQDLVKTEGVPTGFTGVGHIAHLNLIERYLPFRYLVGQVIMEKNSTSIRTVVNKLDNIDTQFRFFKMELLAGDPDFVAHVSESDCLFSFDFRTVYWNSRLHAEHSRLINKFRPNQVVSDVMAGVGPFAVPAAKKGVWVLANDLNPKSYESLVTNGKSNHVLDSTQDDLQGKPTKDNHQLDGGLKAFCQDGREFIRSSIKTAWFAQFPGRPKGFSEQEGNVKLADEKLIEFGRKTFKAKQKVKRAQHAKRQKENKKQQQQQLDQQNTDSLVTGLPDIQRHESRRLIDHFVMNLPASALEFLDAFRGAYRSLLPYLSDPNQLEQELSRRRRLESINDSEIIDTSQEYLPWVHVHCFSKDPLLPVQDILNRANTALGLESNHENRLIAAPILPRQNISHLPIGFLESHPAWSQVKHLQTNQEIWEYFLQQFHQLNQSVTKDLEIHYVRDVAPNKQMYCLSFRLPRQVLFEDVV